MYKIIKFSDGTETIAYEPDNVEVNVVKDNTDTVGYIFMDEKPKKVKGKYIIKNEKGVVDLTKDKPHNKAKEPVEPNNMGTL